MNTARAGSSSECNKPKKPYFLNQPAPPGYVAGIGRGATGFTTRSDIGPAREAAANADGPPRKVARKGDDDDDEDESFLNDNGYDEFTGYSGSLFSKGPYDKDDEEADRIYQSIEKHMDERGKSLREAKTRQELEHYRQERPKIQQQFSDLKASLRQVSEEDWARIPEVGDSRNRKQRVARADKFTPLPDSLLAHQAKIASGGERLVYIDPKDTRDDDDDDDDNDDDNGNNNKVNINERDNSKVVASDKKLALNIGEMSEFRSSVMSMKLNQLSNALDGQAAADPQDYLTNLQSIVPSQITDASTLKLYRKQFASLRASNPNFPNAWIASVRLEEAAGKLKNARTLIMAACEQCPKSADLWCEAVRLHPSDFARRLMVKALRELPRSIKLWLKAADLENDDEAKREVYRKARVFLPKCVLLWKKSVELERDQPARARIILREAVECCPEAVELWLALAKLEPYEEAQRVLIKANEKHPTDRSVWINAARLEEEAGNKSLVGSIIARAVEKLSEHGIEIKREEWLREAVDADLARCETTCHEIIKRIIGWNIPEADRLKVWLEDAQKFVAGKSIDCARAVYKAIVDDKKFSKMESVWLSLVNFEREHGGNEASLEIALREAVKPENCIKSETLWLMLADVRRQHLDETRQILSDALDANPDGERIIIAAVELECENGNHKEARRILADACMSAKTPQLVRRAAELEWSLGNLNEVQRMLEEGIKEYRNFTDFYLMLGKLEEQREQPDKAKTAYSEGLKFNPTSIELWLSMASIEERTGFLAKARSRLEMARIRNPKVARLWLEAARLELRVHQSKRSGGRPDVASTILAKGIRECKDSEGVDLLHAEQLLINKRPTAR